MRTSVFVCLLGISLARIPAIAQTQAVDWVNEYIGTASQGQTFLSTAPPFAMTQWTPQTREGNVKCIAPYYYADARIQGFRGSHFLSGSCTQDYGSMTLMPESGQLKLGAAERSSAFSRATEKASPFRYEVTLSDYGIQTEMAATSRAGIMRFRFDRAEKSWILVECNSAKGEGAVKIDPEKNEITVVNPVRRLYAGSGKLAGFNGYFVVQFDHPFRVGGTWAGQQNQPASLSQQGADGPPGAYVSFDLKPGETVQAKIGSSFTSIEEARRNLVSEIPAWNFQQVVEQTRADWNMALSKIQVQATTPQKHILYYQRENPRLCRGGSSSLTFPGVHPETLQREPPSKRRGETGWTNMQA